VVPFPPCLQNVPAYLRSSCTGWPALSGPKAFARRRDALAQCNSAAHPPAGGPVGHLLSPLSGSSSGWATPRADRWLLRTPPPRGCLDFFLPNSVSQERAVVSDHQTRLPVVVGLNAVFRRCFHSYQQNCISTEARRPTGVALRTPWSRIEGMVLSLTVRHGPA